MFLIWNRHQLNRQKMNAKASSRAWFEGHLKKNTTFSLPQNWWMETWMLVINGLIGISKFSVFPWWLESQSGGEDEPVWKVWKFNRNFSEVQSSTYEYENRRMWRSAGGETTRLFIKYPHNTMMVSVRSFTPPLHPLPSPLLSLLTDNLPLVLSPPSLLPLFLISPSVSCWQGH